MKLFAKFAQIKQFFTLPLIFSQFLIMNRMQSLKDKFFFGCQGSDAKLQDLQKAKQILSKDLFSIGVVNKSVNRDILSMAYTPGVGAVCLQIQKKPQLADELTFRGRAIAIVSDGSMLQSSGKKFMPVMDWLVSQIKYYSGLDSFPFVIKKETNLEQLFKDLSNSYGTILYLDDSQKFKIPDHILFVKQQEISKLFNTDLTDGYITANILSYLIQAKVKGFANEQHYLKIMKQKVQTNNFVNTLPYDFQFHDGRSINDHSMQFHKFYKGKILIDLNFRDINKIKPFFNDKIFRKLVQQENVSSKTSKLCAIVTDGTSILGLGNIGPMAGLPVMEGKSLIFKLLGNVDVVPFCMYPRQKMEDQIRAIDNSVGYFAAINLEDIKAPQCFAVQTGLKALKNQPIFHDDQHGTAIVVLGGLINALKVADKKIGDCKIIINGAGAAGMTIAKLIVSYGVKHLVVCDTKGAIYKGRKQGMNKQKQQLAGICNSDQQKGSLQEVIKKADVFIGVSAAGALKGDWIKSMNKKAIIFALANPTPEIMPEEAIKGGAFIYASGRSDYPNQINNSLVFPGIFKGIIKHGIRQITQQMKILASEAISKSLLKQPTTDYIIPDSLDRDVTLRIAQQIGKFKKNLF